MAEENGKAGPTKEDVTPAMLDAGVAVLFASGRVSPNLVDWAACELVRDIFLAMAHAKEGFHDQP